MSRLLDCRSALRASCSRPRLRGFRRQVLPVSALAAFGVTPVSAPRDLRVVGVRHYGLRSAPVPAMAVNYSVWPRKE